MTEKARIDGEIAALKTQLDEWNAQDGGMYTYLKQSYFSTYEGTQDPDSALGKIQSILDTLAQDEEKAKQNLQKEMA